MTCLKEVRAKSSVMTDGLLLKNQKGCIQSWYETSVGEIVNSISEEETLEASHEVIAELSDEVCPDVVYNQTSLASLLDKMNVARAKEREKDAASRKIERHGKFYKVTTLASLSKLLQLIQCHN